MLAHARQDFSRVRLQQFIRNGEIYQSDKGKNIPITNPAHKVKQGEVYHFTPPPPVDSRLRPQNIALDILHEDEAVIVINKPAGMVVHPAPGSPDSTLVNALIAHCGNSLSGIGGERRPGIVHRLDKETSGVMVVAKHDKAHQALAEQFAAHGRDGRLKRIYDALIWGVPLLPQGKIEASLTRSQQNRKKITVADHSAARHAVTHYHMVKAAGLLSHIACQLETGRTHQIRVHMAHIGHPVIADKLYGTGWQTRIHKLPPAQADAVSALQRHGLHARLLGFDHPITGAAVSFSAPPPTDMENILATL